jgi:hypothetical protein
VVHFTPPYRPPPDCSQRSAGSIHLHWHGLRRSLRPKEPTGTRQERGEEIRLVCFVSTTEAAGQDGTGDEVDTVATKDVAGERGTLCCSEMTENSTAVSNPINLIPIGLDTAAIPTVVVETGIGGLTDIRSVRAFVSLCSYYRRYIWRFAEIAAPLTNLLKDGG